MASVPHSFDPEPGSNRCGDSYRKLILANGLLPNTKGFGLHLRHTVRPVVLPGSVTDPADTDAGVNEETIESIRAMVQERLGKVLDGIELNDHLFRKADRDSLRWLVRHSEAELEAATQIWERWADREEGSWSLDNGDTLDTFWQPRDPRDCFDPDELMDPPGPNYGRWVPSRHAIAGTPSAGVQVRCPTLDEVAARPFDRTAIQDRLRDALRHLRCAEYWYWRVLLYRRALQEWEEKEPGIVVTSSFAALPPVGQPVKEFEPPPLIDPKLGIYRPPPDPPDFRPPSTDDLPDPDSVPMPDGAAPPGVLPPGALPRAGPLITPTRIVLGAALLLGGVYLLRR